MSSEEELIGCCVIQCAYCRAPIVSGARWVREKIYNPALNGRDPTCYRYHAETFAWQEASCWGKNTNGNGNWPNHRLRRLEASSDRRTPLGQLVEHEFANSPLKEASQTHHDGIPKLHAILHDERRRERCSRGTEGTTPRRNRSRVDRIFGHHKSGYDYTEGVSTRL